MACKKVKNWNTHYRYITSIAGGSIAAIASIAVAAWGVWKLGIGYGCECEAEYLNALLYNELGDEWDKHRLEINKQIDKDFKK